jgi:hypothetical protein
MKIKRRGQHADWLRAGFDILRFATATAPRRQSPTGISGSSTASVAAGESRFRRHWDRAPLDGSGDQNDAGRNQRPAEDNREGALTNRKENGRYPRDRP